MGLKALNLKTEMYIEYLVQGYSQRQAYLKAFPMSKNSRPSQVDHKSYLLFHKEEIQKRYLEVKERTFRELRERGLWTKEQAVNELKDLLDKNKTESERYEKAYIDEMAFLDHKIEQCREQMKRSRISKKEIRAIEDKIDSFEYEKIKVNRRHQSNKSVNDAILQSIQQLNEMMDFKHMAEVSEKEQTQVQIVFSTDVDKTPESIIAEQPAGEPVECKEV